MTLNVPLPTAVWVMFLLSSLPVLAILFHVVSYLRDTLYLRRFPGPPLARLSDVWLAWHCGRGTINRAVLAAHRTYGMLFSFVLAQCSLTIYLLRPSCPHRSQSRLHCGCFRPSPRLRTRIRRVEGGFLRCLRRSRYVFCLYYSISSRSHPQAQSSRTYVLPQERPRVRAHHLGVSRCSHSEVGPDVYHRVSRPRWRRWRDDMVLRRRLRCV